jgi:exonuclease III
MINLIQYIARSLTKSNLIEFKSYLHKHKPHLVLISETFWKDTFSVKFKQYYVVNKNRSNQPEGGVAILIHKSLQYSMLQLPNLQTIEAIGISVSIENNGQKEMLKVVSIYIPNCHQSNEDELDQLIADNNSLIISGDFNAKHGLWETDCQHPNRSGRAVFSLLEKEDKIMLADFYQDSEPSNKHRIFYNTLVAANKSSGIKLKKNHRMPFNQSPLKCGGTRTTGEQSPNQEKREMHAIPKEEG